MNASKGYFSLVQYSPDIARQEAANVGVVLFCPDRQFIRAKVSESIRRIRRFFGDDVAGYHQLNAMKDALVNRVEIEKDQFTTLEDLQQFVATRGNNILLTQPKPVMVLDPEQDLTALFEELVADPQKPLTVQATIPLRKRLDAVLMEQAVKRYIRTKLDIEAPALRETIRIPYAFQNGRFNLIQPIEFKHQSEASVRTAACKHAVEGLTLFKHRHPTYGDLQLLVVADFSSATQGASDLVRSIFNESHVRLFTSDAIDTLKQEILTQGKALPAQQP
jgi:hypothetical protein